MIEIIRNAWKIDDLRRKMLFTLAILVLFRIGASIPVPFLDPYMLSEMINDSGSLFGYLNILSGGAFADATVFALGIGPYITSSIVIQLLTFAIPALERLSKEGEEGKKKLNKITRYATLVMALISALAYYMMIRNTGALKYTTGFGQIFSSVVIILSFMAGALIVVWLGEQIDKNGIGNGISMILFAGIVSQGPAIVQTIWIYLQAAAMGETRYFIFVPIIIVVFVLLIAFIVTMTEAERRIPVQYAKRIVGRKQYGGQSTHIPIKVSMSGVLPVIFAGAILSIPSTILGFTQMDKTAGFGKFLAYFTFEKPIYSVLYFILIIAFSYFYVSIQYNPIEMANNLRKNNGAIPGIRPGKPTSDFIQRIISRITLVGALFLAFVAILPVLIGAISKMNISLGGTSIIIVVGVALEFVKQLESQMMMRHYKGFLE